MREFDELTDAFCGKRSLIYSRYADDVFISAFEEGVLGGVAEFIQDTATKVGPPNLMLNRDKTAYLSKRRKRVVTGLVLTTDGRVSIGRSRKRAIKSKVHSALNGELDKYETSQLSGLIAFCFDVEKSFYDALCIKYGQDNIEMIRGLRSVSLKSLGAVVDLD